MDNKTLIFEIKNRITIRDVFEKYGFCSSNKKRIPCMFHHGKNENLGFTDDFYHCFKCGATGDVITFVQQYFKLSFSESLKKLDDDFGLGLTEHFSKREQIEIARLAYDKQRIIKSKEKEKQALYNDYWRALDDWIRFDGYLIKHKPKNNDTELHHLYIEALKNIGYARHCLDCAEERIYLYENKNN